MAPHQQQKINVSNKPYSPRANLLGEYSVAEALASLNGNVNDVDQVIVVQPEPARGKRKHKKGSKKGEPVNCPHLEKVLFFFGIAGMIVSIVMLVQHIFKPFY